MNKTFTQIGHCISVCLLLCLFSLTGISRSFLITHTGISAASVNDSGKEYTLFEARLINNHSVSLNWSKETSDNNSQFEVERSFDRTNYKTVAIVMSPEVDFIFDGTFKFKDNSKDLSGKSEAWYRIKEVNSEGQVFYSPIRKVSLNLNIPTVNLFPNPFIETLKVGFYNQLEGKANVRLLNFNGDEITSKSVGLIRGKNSIEFPDLSTVSNGIYIVEISMNGTVTERLKVIKK